MTRIGDNYIDLSTVVAVESLHSGELDAFVRPRGADSEKDQIPIRLSSDDAMALHKAMEDHKKSSSVVATIPLERR